MAPTRQRASIAGESWNKSVEWKPPVHKKTDEQRAQIKAACLRSFMFAALEPQMLETVLDAFQGPMEKNENDTVISQGATVTSGEPGLYIIESGTLDVFKVTDSAPAPGKKVFAYDKTGQSFGELALLYNCPRAATVVATSKSVLWSIDRDTFNNCVKGAVQEMHERREKLLGTVDILKDLTSVERGKIAEVLQPRVFSKGETVIKQGDAGKEFFILEEGSCHAEVSGQGTVKDYAPGGYFGELALLKNQDRAATVIADSTPTKLAQLDSDSFERLLGSLKDLMSERAKEYTGADKKKGY